MNCHKNEAVAVTRTGGSMHMDLPEPLPMHMNLPEPLPMIRPCARLKLHHPFQGQSYKRNSVTWRYLKR